MLGKISFYLNRRVNFINLNYCNNYKNFHLLLDSTGEDLFTDDTKTVTNTSQVKVDFTDVDIIDEALNDIDLEGLTVFSYQDLQIATKIFSDKRIEEGGCKIGEGAYGSVYQAIISDAVIAVKKLKDPVDKQFITELKILTRYFILLRSLICIYIFIHN